MFRQKFIIVLMGLIATAALFFFKECESSTGNNHFGIKRNLRGRITHNGDYCYL